MRQAVLECLPKALNPPLGLWRARKGKANAEFGNRTPKLSGGFQSSEFFLERKLLRFGRTEDGVTVDVKTNRDTVRRDTLMQHSPITLQALRRGECGADDSASGVVDRSMQGEAGTAVF